MELLLLRDSISKRTSAVSTASTRTSSPPQSVLLLGAGELGAAILRALSSHPSLAHTKLTLLLRPQTLSNSAHLDSLRALLPANRKPGLQFTSADLASTSAAQLSSLIRAANYDAVISCTGFAAGPGTQTKICDAVLAAGCVRRFLPWQFGVDYDVIGRGSAQDLFDEQVGVREMLRNQDRRMGAREGDGEGEESMGWTIVSTGMFVSFLFEEWFGVVEGLVDAISKDKEVVVRALGSWSNSVTVTAVEDIGRSVAEVLTSPPPTNDKGGSVIYTAGETISYARLADVVEKVLGKRVRREKWTVAFLKEELKQDPNNQIKKYRVVFAEGKGVSWEMERGVHWQRGIETVDVEKWLRKHLGE